MFVSSQLGMMTCSKMYGMLRDPGAPLSLEQVARTKINWFSLIIGAPMSLSILPWSAINVLCHVSLIANWFSLFCRHVSLISDHLWQPIPQCDLEEDGGFMNHTCFNEEDLEPYNCKRSKFETSVSDNFDHLDCYCKTKDSKVDLNVIAGSGRYRDVSTIWQLDIL